MSIGKILKVLPALVFSMMLGVGFLLIIAFPKEDFSKIENRNLSQFPSISKQTITGGDFEKEIEDYLNDHFPFRNKLVSLNTKRELLLGKRMVNGVYYAKDGYLIEYHDENDIDKDMEKNNARILSGAASYFGKKIGNENVKIYLTQTKENALSYLLPGELTPYDGGKMVNRVKKRLKKEGADIKVIDTSLILSDAEGMYYYTDHHWVSDAAKEVYEKWCEDEGEDKRTDIMDKVVVSDSFCGSTYSKVLYSSRKDEIVLYESSSSSSLISVTYPDDSDVDDRDSMYQMDRLSHAQGYEVFFGGNFSDIVIHNDNGNGKRLVIFKDSFANCFVPFLAGHYSDILMIDLRYLDEPIKDVLDGFGEYDDLIFMYNTIKLAQDTDLYKLSEYIEDDGDSFVDKGDSDIVTDDDSDIMIDDDSDIMIDDDSDIMIDD